MLPKIEISIVEEYFKLQFDIIASLADIWKDK
jgi:hypothetical protein